MKSEWRALKTLQSLANARKSSVINTGKKKQKITRYLDIPLQKNYLTVHT